MAPTREVPHVADRTDDPRGQGMGPMPKIWVRVVPEACTSASMCSSRSAIFSVQRPYVAQHLRS